MDVEYCATGKEPFQSVLTEFDANPDINGLFVLSAANNAPVSSDIDDLLKDISTPIFGGIFPEVVFEGESQKRGIHSPPKVLRQRRTSSEYVQRREQDSRSFS